MSDILPPVIPPIMPSLSGPALSYSSVRKVTDAASNLLDSLQTSIRSSVSSGLAAAAREGARLETKVGDKLGKQLTPPEQLIDHITSLVQNTLAGSLAQAVQTFEDVTNIGGATSGLGDIPRVGTQQSESFVYNPAKSQANTPTVAPMRATGVTAAVPGPAGRATSRAISNLPVASPRAAICTLPDRPTAIQWAAEAQAVADKVVDPTGLNLGACYYGFDDTCCEKSTCGSPHDLEAQYPPNWTQCLGPLNGIDYGPNCRYIIFQLSGTDKQQRAGHDYLHSRINPKGVACGPPPPPPGEHGGNGTCPTQPCTIDVTCPPPVINVPPCPPVDLNLPTCIQIDLCDWDKFCKLIKDCLTQSKEDCALDNETAYTYKDCDGSYGEAQYNWLGTLANGVAQQETVDDINALAQQLPAALTADNFGPLQPY